MMETPLALLLLAAVGYFAASVISSILESQAQPQARYTAITNALDKFVSSHYATKQPDGAYLFWPKGTIDSVTYDGAFATYIKPIPNTLGFRLVSYVYAKAGSAQPSWKQIEDFTAPSVEFGSKLSHVVGLPSNAKLELIHAKGPVGSNPANPPSH